jgi:hypothetical protein
MISYRQLAAMVVIVGLSVCASHAQEMTRDVGIGMHFHSPATLRLIASYSPIGSVRLWDTRTNWNQLQPERERWDFARLDEYVESASARGMKVLFVLGQTPKWASSRPDERSVYGEGAAAMPRDLADWENYVRVLVRRYKGRIEAYEVMNEPKVRGASGCGGVVFFCGAVADLVELSRIVKKVVRETDPEAKVVSPSFDHGEYGNRMLREFLALGGAQHVDAIAIHFYDLDPDNMVRSAQRINQLLRAAGQSKPVWNTETGFLVQNGTSTVVPDGPGGWGSRVFSASEVLDRMQRVFVGLKGAGVERTYWYAWDNTRMGFNEAVPAAIQRLKSLSTPPSR